MTIENVINKIKLFSTNKNIVKLSDAAAIEYKEAKYFKPGRLALFEADVYIIKGDRLDKKHFDSLCISYALSTMTGIIYNDSSNNKSLELCEMNSNGYALNIYKSYEYASTSDYIQLYGDYSLIIHLITRGFSGILRKEKWITFIESKRVEIVSEWEYKGNLHIFFFENFNQFGQVVIPDNGNSDKYRINTLKPVSIQDSALDFVYVGRFRYIETGEEIEAIGKIRNTLRRNTKIILYDFNLQYIDEVPVNKIEYITRESLKRKWKWMYDIVCINAKLMDSDSFIGMDPLCNLKVAKDTIIMDVD